VAVMPCRNPLIDSSLWWPRVDRGLWEAEGRRWIASEGIGLCEKKGSEQRAPMTHFGSTRERTKESDYGGATYRNRGV
jgi:hypothetical protein